MNKKGIHVLIHILAWLVFLSFPFIFFPKTKAFLAAEDMNIFLYFIIPSSLASIGFFYLNFYFAIPRFYLKKKYLKYSLIILSCFAFAMFTGWLASIYEQSFQSISLPPLPSSSTKDNIPPPGKEFFHLGATAFRFVNIFVLSFALRIYSQWRLAEQEKVKFQLSFLQAQINPHFLFNILNSIYSLILNKSEHAADAVVKLSSIMRYVISEATQNTVPLYKEIKYVSDYFELQRLRLAENIKLEYHVVGESINKQITPLILLPFIENAFKHGVSMEEECEIKISITADVNMLKLVVLNKKLKLHHQEKDASGMGIENTMNRLQLLYPGRHKITIDDNPQFFIVELNIQLA